MAALFRLTVSDYQGLGAWSWKLRGSRDVVIAERAVRMDTAAWQYTAACDLHEYIAVNGGSAVAAAVAAQVGDWLWEQVFGPDSAAILTGKKGPAVVRVSLPAEARDVASLPLELARTGGHSLQAHRVTLVWSLAGNEENDAAAGETADRLRMLALFPALPGTPSLNQRRERLELGRLLAGIAATDGKAIEFRSLQYGVTAGKLRRALESYPGWDVVHVCGYAQPELLAFPPARPGDSDEHIGRVLDDLVYGKVKLVTVSPCESSAAIMAAVPAPPVSGWTAHGFPQVAAISRDLECAVLTFRFPVPDEFAVAYFGRLYELLLVSGQPLAEAATMALSAVLSAAPPETLADVPPLAVPALFGPRAADLRVTAPAGAARMHTSTRAPARFVGRDDEMRDASAALEKYSGVSALVLHGVPGAGKTTCARELAHTRNSLDPDNKFLQTIWHTFPGEESADPGLALDAFAKRLSEIRGFPVAAADFRASGTLAWRLPDMTEFFENYRYLIVLDNVDALLTASGEWRDDRWRQVIDALTDQAGFSRVIITCRRVPASLDPLAVPEKGPRLRLLPVQPFRHDTAVLLARELRGLRSLLDGTAPGIGDPDEARRLGWRVVDAARGHPKLLELADAAVSDPGQLSRLLAVAAGAWQDNMPFGGYVHVMERWTATVVESLAVTARAFFHAVCRMTENDRTVRAIAEVWPRLAAALALDAGPDGCEQLIEEMRRWGLATREAIADDASVIQVHPVLARYGRSEMFVGHHVMIDAELAAYWARAAAAGDGLAALRARSYLSRLDEETARRILVAGEAS